MIQLFEKPSLEDIVKLWQTETIADVQRLFTTNHGIKALILIGSNASEDADQWSDVDFICIIEDTAVEQFYPATEWLTPLGDVFAIDQSTAQFRFVTRVCFTDFRRADFVFIAESAMLNIKQWLYPKSQTQLLFSRSAIVDKVLEAYPVSANTPPQFDDRQFIKMTNQFWFRAVMAVNKVMRNDHLIGLHLALDLYRDCLVLGMIFRDREAGTTVHRFGGPYNEILDYIDLPDNPNSKADGILNVILQSAKLYDRLALHWSVTYRPRYEPFEKWVQVAGENPL